MVKRAYQRSGQGSLIIRCPRADPSGNEASRAPLREHFLEIRFLCYMLSYRFFFVVRLWNSSHDRAVLWMFSFLDLLSGALEGVSLLKTSVLKLIASRNAVGFQSNPFCPGKCFVSTLWLTLYTQCVFGHPGWQVLKQSLLRTEAYSLCCFSRCNAHVRSGCVRHFSGSGLFWTSLYWSCLTRNYYF